MNPPLAASLLILIISHFALTLVTVHETRQAEHRCGMDEVKMAAYVGIGAGPLLALLLFLINVDIFQKPFILAALLTSIVKSLKSLHTLLKYILPKRASFPAPREGWQKTEAKWFGTIAASHGPRLVLLCIGCGWAMVMPLYVSVLSVLINLSGSLAKPTSAPAVVEVTRGLYLTQALVSVGLAMASILLLITIYLLYLNLGRWFSKRNTCQS
ncbi:MAG: hypothetical protein JW704_02805 [Anaerolineaceae bacterium]|nr:hypothetical protein [Anaerolineaceae bacterium]